MLEFGVKCRVTGEYNGIVVVAHEGRGSGLTVMKAGKELMQPGEFLGGFTWGDVFGLAGGEGDERLVARGPKDDTRP